jgi:hypothetical protein
MGVEVEILGGGTKIKFFLTFLSFYAPVSLAWGLFSASLSVVALLLQKSHSNNVLLSALGRLIYEVRLMFCRS